jgi:excisionase family DNA binding protein
MPDHTPTTEPEPWLTVAEAARYRSCSPSRIHLLVREGKLSAVRDGRRLLFRRAQLDETLVPVETTP